MPIGKHISNFSLESKNEYLFDILTSSVPAKMNSCIFLLSLYLGNWARIMGNGQKSKKYLKALIYKYTCPFYQLKPCWLMNLTLSWPQTFAILLFPHHFNHFINRKRSIQIYILLPCCKTRETQCKNNAWLWIWQFFSCLQIGLPFLISDQRGDTSHAHIYFETFFWPPDVDFISWVIYLFLVGRHILLLPPISRPTKKHILVIHENVKLYCHFQRKPSKQQKKWLKEPQGQESQLTFFLLLKLLNLSYIKKSYHKKSYWIICTNCQSCHFRSG